MAQSASLQLILIDDRSLKVHFGSNSKNSFISARRRARAILTSFLNLSILKYKNFRFFTVERASLVLDQGSFKA